MEKQIPFSTNRAAPDKPNVMECCKIEGNLEWNETSENETSRNFLGICKICGSKHYVMRVKPIKWGNT
jgi:hypothetical protein